MKMKKVLAAALVGAMAIGMFGCGSGSNANTNEQDGQAEAENSNQLRIGMECGYAPFNWTVMVIIRQRFLIIRHMPGRKSI